MAELHRQLHIEIPAMRNAADDSDRTETTTPRPDRLPTVSRGLRTFRVDNRLLSACRLWQLAAARFFVFAVDSHFEARRAVCGDFKLALRVFSPSPLPFDASKRADAADEQKSHHFHSILHLFQVA